jgi:hypothetical protein
MARNYKQGYFKPTNPQKYKGNVNNIFFRSSWEYRFLQWCDVNPAVIAYHSEETVVPYLCETDNRLHRYFVDMRIAIKDSNGNVNHFLVEIKPFNQTIPPKYNGRNSQRYNQELETFIKNQSKWKAARKYAEERNMKFIVLTENELLANKK